MNDRPQETDPVERLPLGQRLFVRRVKEIGVIYNATRKLQSGRAGSLDRGIRGAALIAGHCDQGQHCKDHLQ